MKTKIIIVEDELIIARHLKNILVNEGYEVIDGITTVENAKKIIEEENPQLVLIDINLKQQETGIDLAAYLLEKDTIPYIYISSYSDAITLEKVNETRPHGFIVKPFKVVDVQTTVSIVLNNFKKNSTFSQYDIPDNNVPFRIKKTLEYIEDNLNIKIDIEILAKKCNWEKQHFIRMFAKYVGETPYQYILKRKIEKSKILLTQSNLSINEISGELGFVSYSNFFKQFKKITNYTPENFRVLHKK